MEREDVIEEIAGLISKAKLQASGFADYQKEEAPEDLAEYIFDLVGQYAT